MNTKTIYCAIVTLLIIAILHDPVFGGKFLISTPTRTNGRTYGAPHIARTPFRHWDLRQFTDCKIPFSFFNGPDSLFVGPDTIIGTTAAFVHVVSAFDSWRNVGPAVIDFEHVIPQPPECSSGVVGVPAKDSYNMISWGTLPEGASDPGGVPEYDPAPSDPDEEDEDDYPEDQPDSTDETQGTLAVTFSYFRISSGRILEADILFNNDDYNWVVGNHDLDADPPRADVQSVAAHEIGHFIGIAHDPDACGDAPDPDCATMNALVDPFDGTVDQRTLEGDDADACNFLYNPDLGDAPDPMYTTMIHTSASGESLNCKPLLTRLDVGPVHLFGTRYAGGVYHYELLGTSATGECNPNFQQDLGDDGVLYNYAVQRGGFITLNVNVITRRDIHMGFHRYGGANPKLYLNVMIDWNQNGVFGDVVDEFVVGNPQEVVNPPIPGLAPPWQNILIYNKPVPATAAIGITWMRVRLDWGEDIGSEPIRGVLGGVDGTLEDGVGAAQFGEVEDYPLSVIERFESDLGDLQQCNYPTLGAYDTHRGNPGHTVSNVAWLGNCVTAEVTPNTLNLDGCDDGILFLNLPWTPCETESIRVTVSSSGGFQNLPLFFNFWVDGDQDLSFRNSIISDCGGVTPEWVIENYPVTPAGSPYTLAVRLPGRQTGGPHNLICRARLTQHSLFATNAQLDSCLNIQRWYTPEEDSVGEVEDYILTDEILSVELTSFTAIAGDREVMLQWITASEIDNERFDIERDGVLVQRMDGQGTTSEAHNYSWRDTGLDNGRIYYYTLISVDFEGYRHQIGTVEATPRSDLAVITEYALHPNYPNPFNPNTTIEFDLPVAAEVELVVFDLLGREIAQLANGAFSAGRHVVTFEGSGLASGIYWYRLRAGEFEARQKMLLLK